MFREGYVILCCEKTINHYYETNSINYCSGSDDLLHWPKARCLWPIFRQQETLSVQHS